MVLWCRDSIHCLVAQVDKKTTRMPGLKGVEDWDGGGAGPVADKRLSRMPGIKGVQDWDK
jgi:hypothetical protein